MCTNREENEGSDALADIASQLTELEIHYLTSRHQSGVVSASDDGSGNFSVKTRKAQPGAWEGDRPITGEAAPFDRWHGSRCWLPYSCCTNVVCFRHLGQRLHSLWFSVSVASDQVYIPFRTSEPHSGRKDLSSPTSQSNNKT